MGRGRVIQSPFGPHVRKKGGGGFFKKFGSTLAGGVGAAFGGFAGGPLGAKIGYGLGSSFGSAAFNKNYAGLAGVVPSLFDLPAFTSPAPTHSPYPMSKPGPGAPLLSPMPSPADVPRQIYGERARPSGGSLLRPGLIEIGPDGTYDFAPHDYKVEQQLYHLRKNAVRNRRSGRRVRAWVRDNWDVSP